MFFFKLPLVVNSFKGEHFSQSMFYTLSEAKDFFSL